ARRFDPFEPIYLFAIASGVIFVVRPTAMLVDGDLTYFNLDISPPLPRALLLALIGAVAFLTAYEARAGGLIARRLPPPRSIEARHGLISAAVMTALAFLALLGLFKGFSKFHLLLDGRSYELGPILSGS